MEKEEFKKHFKIGKKYCYKGGIKGEYIKIISYCVNGFEYSDQNGDFKYFNYNSRNFYAFMPYEEEKPKDLDGVFPFFEVMKDNDGLWVVPHYGNKEYFEYLLCEEREESEILTMEEAEERGLNLSMF